MTRHRPGNRRKPKQLSELNSNSKPLNVLQTNRSVNESNGDESTIDELTNIKSLLIDDTPDSPKAGTSTSTDDNLGTAALHSELDSFRQRWKRELTAKESEQSNIQADKLLNSNHNNDEKENKTKPQDLTSKEFYAAISNPPDNPLDVYALAKKLFLIGVQLEQDEMHYESIRYYKQAMHLYPDIERQIFREQNEASSAKSNIDSSSLDEKQKTEKETDLNDADEEQLPLYERISLALSESLDTGRFYYCRPTPRHKAGSRHISELPHDLLLQIYRYVVGQELDLASLEALGLVCRGFFLLSRDSSLWRSICYRTWSSKMSLTVDQIRNRKQLDWRRIYLDRPRVNFDGVYISRTRYIRQGDTGFQDMTYRPFHVVRYYRYLRFFPDKRVLILTTNEEPERIIPIFRNASHAKQFSSELSILEGSYDLVETNQLVIVAKKDFTIEQKNHNQQLSLNQKRRAQFHWSRQTPLSQRFDIKLELRTIENRPYRNNVLKWVEYSITSRLETGEEITTFDLSPDSFPNLLFSRVKTFNLRQTEPLSSH